MRSTYKDGILELENNDATQIEEIISTKRIEENGEYIDEYGVKYSTDRKKLIEGNHRLKEYTVLSGTQVICVHAFNAAIFHSALYSITIPSSVISIENEAFLNCNNLENIDIQGDNFIFESGILYTKNKARIISALPHLLSTHVIIPNSVTSIGEGAFSACLSLQSINIPNSVISIGENAFYMCQSLNNIDIQGDNFIFESGILYTKNKVRIISALPHLMSAHVIVPNSVTSIEGGAFSHCESLQSISIPNSVCSIGKSAFTWCKSLKNIDIPNSITTIEYHAFAWCNSLENITIPNSVTSIGENAFSGCKFQSITIPNSVTFIGDRAFVNCESLQSIRIPSSVVSIGRDAFYGCKSLQCIDIQGNNFIFENGILYTKNKVHIISALSHLIPTHVVIPSSVTSIGDRAFYKCKSIQSIDIPSSVTSIADRAFSECNFAQEFKKELIQSFGISIFK